MVIIQQFSSPETPERNSLSERDGRTIMDVTQCMLNGALGGKTTATAMFLLNHPPNKTIGGNTPYYSMFVKLIDLSFMRTIGARPHGGRQAHLKLTSRHTQSPHHLQSQQLLRSYWLCDASYDTGNAEKARCTSGSMYFLSEGSFTSAPVSSATKRRLCY